MAKNLILAPVLAVLAHILVPNFVCVWALPLLDARLCFGPDLGLIWAYFVQTWATSSVTRYFGLLLSHVQYQKKLMTQSWEKLVRNRLTEGQTRQSDFMGGCGTNIEPPIFHDKAFNIAKNLKYDGYQCGLASMIYKVFDKKPLVKQLKMKICKNKS